MHETAKSRLFRFGVFEVDAATGELRKQGMRIRLQEQPSAILLMLLEHPGEIVTREEVSGRLWASDTFVDFDQSLGTAIKKLRQALGDTAESPRFIETVPKQGFRFVAPVEKISPSPAPSTAKFVARHASDAALPVRRLRPSRSLWLLVALLVACAASYFVGGSLPFARTSSGRSVIRSSILPPPDWHFEHSSFTLSPDGTRLAFVAVGPDGQDKLWVRGLSSSTAQQIDGTDGALMPFWSPDNRRIAFFAAGKLSVVDLESGSVRTLTDAPFARGGGAWSRNGTIIFSPSVTGPLSAIQDSGGAPSTVTPMPKSPRRHMWPSFLPDGVHFFYSESSGPADPQRETIYVASLNGGDPKVVISGTNGNVAYSSGYLLFGRDHTLWAQPFDVGRLVLTRSAKPITNQELVDEFSFSHGEYSVSENGTLVFQSLSDTGTRLLSIDTNGKQLTTIGEPDYREPRLSPDARLLAFSADEQKNGRFSIGVYDLQRGVATRLTDGGTDRSPAWSKDAKRITYTTLHEIKEVAVDGSGTPETLLKGGVYLGHMDWSTEDQLLFTEMSSGLPSLSIYSPSDQKVRAFAPGAEGRFSPDGKWIAYVGPLTTPGSDAIFVAPFPGPGGRIRVSSASGAQPLWARDGKHLFYVAPDRKLMEVEFDPRTGSAGPPQVLFQTSIVSPNFVDTQYTLSPNGGFFINSFPHIASPLTLQIGSKFGDKH